MKTDYILVEYKNLSFTTTLKISICGITKTVEARIDTGCMRTSINLRSLGVSESEALMLKQSDINNNVPYKRSYGVSDTESDKNRDKNLIASGHLMDCKSLKFCHTPDEFILGGYPLKISEVGVSYDRTGTILIGMDILSQLDIHIGKDKQTGRILFLACPFDNIKGDYLDEMQKHFGYIREYQQFKH